jgi:TRAP-type mannitol/chloroaromatic compound transport system substrate-binding protein
LKINQFLRKFTLKTTLKALAVSISLPLITLSAAAQETVRWGIPMAFGSNLTALGDTMPWVSEQLKKISGGSVNLQVFEPGKLVPALGIFDAVSSGKVEAGYSFMGYELGKVPVSASSAHCPLAWRRTQFAAWVYFGGGDALIKEAFKPHNVYPILCGSISPEAAGWFRKEIKTPADLAGLKMRAAAIGGKVYQKLGASVTMLPGGELFQALEKGVLDATEFSLPSVDEQLGFYKVAKHYYLPGWHQPSTNQFLYVNMAAWAKLKPQTQAQIETTCVAGVTMAIAKAEAAPGRSAGQVQKGRRHTASVRQEGARCLCQGLKGGDG